MPKLPSNLVKPAPPAFDNPLRRTSTITAQEPESADSGVPEALATVISLPLSTSEPEPPTTAHAVAPPVTEPASQLNARISVRLDDALFVALQTECYERRVRGEKTNVAEVAREVLGRWAQRRATSKR